MIAHSSRTIISRQLQKDIDIRLFQQTRLAPSQTRIIPIILNQVSQFTESTLRLEVKAASGGREQTLWVDLPVKQLPVWNASDFAPIISTYFFAESSPTAFVAIPPREENPGYSSAPLLFLRTS